MNKSRNLLKNAVSVEQYAVNLVKRSRLAVLIAIIVDHEARTVRPVDTQASTDLEMRGHGSQHPGPRIGNHTGGSQLNEVRLRDSALRHRGSVALKSGATPSPIETQTQLITDDLFARTLEGLPAEFREAIVMREFEGLSYKEIAALAGIPVGTAMSHTARGRKRLLTIVTMYRSHAIAASSAGDYEGCA